MKQKRIILLLFFLSICALLPKNGNAQSDTFKYKIIVHFKYGSRPAKGFKDKETKWFGGIHGGHVVMQLDSEIFSFYPSDEGFHIFSHKKHKHGQYVLEDINEWVADTATIKFTSITIPLSIQQYKTLQELKEKYLAERPYDYAFIGMRCAAAVYDVLGHINIVKPLPRYRIVLKIFYPKLLRKRLLKYAHQHHLPVLMHAGRKSRIWEDD